MAACHQVASLAATFAAGVLTAFALFSLTLIVQVGQTNPEPDISKSPDIVGSITSQPGSLVTKSDHSAAGEDLATRATRSSPHGSHEAFSSSLGFYRVTSPLASQILRGGGNQVQAVHEQDFGDGGSGHSTATLCVLLTGSARGALNETFPFFAGKFLQTVRKVFVQAAWDDWGNGAKGKQNMAGGVKLSSRGAARGMRMKVHVATVVDGDIVCKMVRDEFRDLKQGFTCEETHPSSQVKTTEEGDNADGEDQGGRELESERGSLGASECSHVLVDDSSAVTDGAFAKPVLSDLSPSPAAAAAAAAQGMGPKSLKDLHLLSSLNISIESLQQIPLPSLPQDPMSTEGEKHPLLSAGIRRTVVTAFSTNHAKVGLLFVRNLALVASKSTLDISLVVYSLGVPDDVFQTLNCIAAEATAAGMQTDLRVFNFSAYPPHMRLARPLQYGQDVMRRDAGLWAWKPVIVREVLLERGLVIWLDSGTRIANVSSLEAAFAHVEEKGFASRFSHKVHAVRSYTHKQTLRFFGAERIEGRMCCACQAGFSWAMMERMVRPWYECAMVKQCIGPDGSSRSNHFQDQSTLSIVAAQAGASCDGIGGGIRDHYDVAQEDETVAPTKCV